MRFLGVYRAWLDSVAVEASTAAIGAWVRLALHAAELELPEPTDGPFAWARIPGAARWSERAVMRVVGLEQSELEDAINAGLAKWDAEDLLVGGYDMAGHRAVEARRSNGKLGGRPTKKTNDSEGKKPTGNRPVSGSKPAANRTKTEPKPLSSPSLSSPSLAPPTRVRASEAHAPSAPKVDTRKIAKVYRVATGNTDLPELPFEWRPKQSMAVTDLARWCGGDCAKLDAELRRLKASDAWLAKQPVHVWAERVGTGAAPTDAVDPVRARQLEIAREAAERTW